MDIKVDIEVYDKFNELKFKYNMGSSSDSAFLLHILDHMDKCNHEENRMDVASQVDVKLDMDTESQLKKRFCPECKYSTCSPADLCEHFESVHPGNGSFSCTCGDQYCRLPDFLQHYVDCPVAATDLQDTTVDVQGRISSSLQHTRLKLDLLDDNSTTTETYHSYHHPSVAPVPGPSKEKPYGCPKCFKGFKSKSLLDQHMHLHYPPRYKCRWCANVYRWPPAYYHHKQKCKKRPTHGNTVGSNSYVSSPGKCSPENTDDADVQNGNFTIAQKALAHFINLHTLAFPQTDKLDIPPFAPLNGQFPSCQPTCVCSEVFPTIPKYFEHVKSCPRMLTASGALGGVSPVLFPTALGVDFPTNLTSERSEQDAPAEDLSLSKETCVYNPSASAGIFSCSICGKDFNSKLSLKQHVDGKHRAEGKYLCPTCGKRYRWGASFYYHKKTCIAPGVASAMAAQTPELLATHT
ncbi:hypothetical protein CSKR_103889 [Clonorchis sinensis]|uniref:C2H2-type domain-containing protein n=2 Tax=Clonorchis sinensis TaxID=79923 RepID=A0A8T1MAN6_CLOSI|nr:hypothetical protein CSKR_103889 [Clonorchis sinensis]